MKLNQSKQLLLSAENYLQKIVAPQASQIDRNVEILKQVLLGMGELSLLGLKIPQNLGGSGFKERDYAHFQILVARYSGALAFLQTQHQTAASMLAASSNQELQQSYLPYLGKGKKLIGVGFSQLRRSGTPMLKAEKVENGYVLEGEVPWITGWAIFDSFIMGATLVDGRELYGIVPLQNQQQKTGGIINFSPTMELVAMNSTNTVSAKFKGWFLEDRQVVEIRQAGSIQEKSQKNVLHHGFFALGCAQAGLDIVKTACSKKPFPFISEFWQELQQEWSNCHQAMLAGISDCTYEEKLQLRVWAINLAARCSHGAVIVSSGAANKQENPASRVYREALLFSVSGQTKDVMEESLKSLMHSTLQIK